MSTGIAIDNIKELYLNDDIQQIIERTVWLFKNAFNVGMNAGQLYTRTHDLGIKPTEMGISMAIALKQTSDTILCEKDRAIKKQLMETMNNEIKTWESELD